MRARRLHDAGIARPILIGERASLEAAATEAEISLESIESVSPSLGAALDAYASLYVEGPAEGERAGGEAAALPAAVLRGDGGEGRRCGCPGGGRKPAHGAGHRGGG